METKALFEKKSKKKFKNLHFFTNLLMKSNPRFLLYKPKVDINIFTNRFQLKSAKTFDELQEVFKLRYKNFLEKDHDKKGGIDIDKFDHNCDHLIIKDLSNDRIIGCYRLISSSFHHKFYSEGEFHLEEFLAKPGIKLELGRACIDQEYRNGRVLDLLWKGIGEYIQQVNADYLFGCSSISIKNLNEAQLVEKSLLDLNCAGEDFKIYTKKKYQYEKPQINGLLNSDIEIPPLLKSYIKAGSLVYGDAAYDRKFGCLDFFTVLNIKNIRPSYEKRYLDA